ncbi:MAG: hypothetical protein R3F61_07915 [Myxococcota bacterium]
MLFGAPARAVGLPEGPGVEYLCGTTRVLGGAPGVRENPDLDVLGWSPPPWLARLYGVHGGLGPWWGPAGRGVPDRWTRHAVLPWDAVTPLTAHIRFGEEGITFDPADCALFAPDGKRGGLVLEGRDAFRIRRFDPERHGLSDPLALETALGWIVSGWIGPG